MWTDIVDLRDFYASSLGQMTARLLRRRIREVWPNLTGEAVLGLGFAPPLLRAGLDEARHVAAVMPPAMGVLRWPSESPCRSVLADEISLPFPDLMFDRVLIVHALESTHHPHAFLREAWRVLKDSGRILVIVPNRMGIWSHLERTPFAVGRPYSRLQLQSLLRDALFTPTQSTGALYLPPSHSRMLLASASAVEEVGRRWFQGFSGVLMAEAAKQVYAAGLTREATVKKRSVVALPQGMGRMSHPPSARSF
ncbi:MAG: methyltransferase domain-containing protein [Alphaproteobacteria bacterium]|jgi:SAM-dependent methyltransferase|nr:methyltransferase domain-containing protein [Alphaproteobacteria bacterium]